jgi:hypothetical protein
VSLAEELSNNLQRDPPVKVILDIDPAFFDFVVGHSGFTNCLTERCLRLDVVKFGEVLTHFDTTFQDFEKGNLGYWISFS